MWTHQQYEHFLSLSRQEIIKHICDVSPIYPLRESEQGKYLFGKTRNDRAICLVWDENNGEIDREQIEGALNEVEAAHLKAPAMIFGKCCSFSLRGDGNLLFMQLPWVFSEREGTVLRALQGMNMRANMHYLRPRE
jgi:hypothetical protein